MRGHDKLHAFVGSGRRQRDRIYGICLGETDAQ